MDQELKAYLDEKFGAVEKRFEKIDLRFEQIDARFEQIDARFEKIDRKFDEIDRQFREMRLEIRTEMHAELQALEDRTAALLGAEIGSLHTELKQLEERLTSRWESIDARLKLQAGLIQSGARAMARFSEFAENSEARWVGLVGRVEAIEDRLRKIDAANPH